MAASQTSARKDDSFYLNTISKRTFVVAGILTTVYGLDELHRDASEVSCLWLLHPRLKTQESMQPIAEEVLRAWKVKSSDDVHQGKHPKGLLAVSFDQRNHGSRQVDARANGAWREGNATHAQDMFSIYNGTASDTSLLITYLSSYVFPSGPHKVTANLVLGVSLGGHAAWHCLMHDARITIGVVVIGCPDFVRLMTERAVKSKLDARFSYNPSGECFLGSAHFPPGLLDAVRKYDPAAIFHDFKEDGWDISPEPMAAERAKLKPLIQKHLGGKRVLNLSGGVDKLVPYECGKQFLDFLKNAVGKGGWCSDQGVLLDDIVFESVGHEMTPDMSAKAVQFLLEALSVEVTTRELTSEPKI